MRKNEINLRSLIFLMTITLVFFVFNKNFLYLTPILTILIPFLYVKLKVKDFYDIVRNQKTLNSLIVFNILSLFLICFVFQTINDFIFKFVSLLTTAYLNNRILEIAINTKCGNIIKYVKRLLYADAQLSTMMRLKQGLLDELNSSSNKEHINKIKKKLASLDAHIKDCENFLKVLCSKIEQASKYALTESRGKD